MKGATKCAARLKQLMRSLRTKLGKAPTPQTSDPVTQMILGIFSRDVPDAKARESLNKLRDMVVDYNELRVIPSFEATKLVGDLPNARIKCEDLSRALNKIFAFEHQVSLDRLKDLSRKDAAEYLDKIDGLDAYSRARILLLGLGHPAVPLDEAMWAYARKQGIVDDNCPLEEAQAFLERRIAEEETLDSIALIEKQAWAEMGAAVRKGDVQHISSIPPDRTTRNMLQMIAGGQSLSEGDVDLDDADDPEALELESDAPVELIEMETPPPAEKKAAPAKSKKDAKTTTEAKPKKVAKSSKAQKKEAPEPTAASKKKAPSKATKAKNAKAKADKKTSSPKAARTKKPAAKAKPKTA